MKPARQTIPTTTPSLKRMLDFVGEMHQQTSTPQTPTSTSPSKTSQPQLWYTYQQDTPIKNITKTYRKYPQDLPIPSELNPQMWFQDPDEPNQTPEEQKDTNLSTPDNIWPTSSPQIQLVLSERPHTRSGDHNSSYKPNWVRRCLNRILRPFRQTNVHHHQ